jgi:hypothetical protein
MRVRPSLDQMIADSMQWSEDLRTLAKAGCDDTVDAIEKLGRMPAFVASEQKTTPQQIIICKDLGLRWGGVPFQKQTLQAIWNIMPFCKNAEFRTSLHKLIRYYHQADTLTFLSKFCVAATKWCKGSFSNPELQKHRAPHTALIWAMDWFQVYMMFGNIEKKNICNNVLVGAAANDVGTAQVWFRKLQIYDFLLTHYRSSKAFSPAIGGRIVEIFASPYRFVEEFASKDFWKRDPEAMEHGLGLGGTKGVCDWTTEAFMEFLKTMPNQATAAWAEILYGILSPQYDLLVLPNCQQNPDGCGGDYEALGAFLRGEAGADPTDLNAAFRKYTQALAGLAVAIDDAQSGQPLAADMGVADVEENEETGQEKKQLYEKVLAGRLKTVRLHALPELATGPLKSYENTDELTKILQNCPFHATKPTGPKDKPKTRAFLLSADLFPGCMQGGAKDYRLAKDSFKEMAVPDAFKSVLKWVITVKKPGDMICVFDGRFRQLRRYVELELAKLGETTLLDFWLIYFTGDQLDDFRYPNRKLAFSNTNREVLWVHRPHHKNSNNSQARDKYNACGEKSTFELTYTDIELRSLAELPKLTTKDKKRMMGSELDIPLAYVDDIDIASEGVPFSWLETKPVPWWSTFYEDFTIDEAFDCTAGSIGAAIGAHISNVQYDGICCNPLHKIWAEQLMEKAMFAVIADGGANADKDYQAKVMHFFGPTIDEGMRLMKPPQKTNIEGKGQGKGTTQEAPETIAVHDNGFDG